MTVSADSLPFSKEFEAIMREAEDLSQGTKTRLSSAHVLLALFTVPNQAQHYLRDFNIDEDRLMENLGHIEMDPSGMLQSIRLRATKMAHGSRSTTVSSLHLLTALSGFKNSAGYRLMEQNGLEMSQIRNKAMSILMRGDVALKFRLSPSKGESPQTDNTILSGRDKANLALGIHPGLEAELRNQSHKKQVREVEKTPPQKPKTTTLPTLPESTSELARRLFSKDLLQKKDVNSEETASKSKQLRKSSKKRAVPGNKNASKKKQDLKFTLDDKEYPYLNRFGKNLTALAENGKIDPVIGRDQEISLLVDILNKRRANNPVLVGEAGVGKTAVVECLALMIVSESPPPGLEGRTLIELNAGQIFSGTNLRGSLAERLIGIMDEVARGEGQIVVFLDEIHRWLGSDGDQNPDGVEELKPALSRGEFPCIGATTHREYRQSIAKDPAFERRFQCVNVEEPDVEATIEILKGVREVYQEHHNVTVSDKALVASARLSHRYILDRKNPDKSLSVLDLAGSKARRHENPVVDEHVIAEVIAEMSGVPASKLLMSERERFLRMEDHLMGVIVGHERNLARIAHVLRRNYAGFISERPIGSFLFLGSTGVGKTETAKALAGFLFHDPDAMTVLDMSEYAESHAVAKLIGSPPGYVGHDVGGQLTDSVRNRPYQIVLLDEVEKSHPSVQNLLLQLLDEGRLTDSKGHLADFTNSVVIMTSNLGSEEASTVRKPLGFGASEGEIDSIRDRVSNAARKSLLPELWNRIDEVLVFSPLTKLQVERIAHLKLQKSSRRLLDERGIAYSCSPGVIDFLLENGGFDEELGARPLRRALERYVEGPIAELILSGEVTSPAEIEVDAEKGELVFEVR